MDRYNPKMDPFIRESMVETHSKKMLTRGERKQNQRLQELGIIHTHIKQSQFPHFFD